MLFASSWKVYYIVKQTNGLCFFLLFDISSLYSIQFTVIVFNEYPLTDYYRRRNVIYIQPPKAEFPGEF